MGVWHNFPDVLPKTTKVRFPVMVRIHARNSNNVRVVSPLPIKAICEKHGSHITFYHWNDQDMKINEVAQWSYSR